MHIAYFDNAATTPVDPRVIEAMLRMLGPEADFGNPASATHAYGAAAEQAVETARGQVADLLHADPREIVFTSGATEGNNLALKGVAERFPGAHIVTSTIEHRAVLDPCAWLEAHGHEITRVAPLGDGRVDGDAVMAAVREDTCLVSLMHANNETGIINDIGAVAAVCRERDVAFHTDAAQSFGKLGLDVRDTPVDLISASAHKLYGPKGVGLLYVRRRPGLDIAPQMHGGGHERGRRSGTLASHQIVGFGEACALAMREGQADNARIAALRDRLEQRLLALGDMHVNGTADRLPGHLNVAVGGVQGELLLGALRRIAVANGSACTSAAKTPSHVLAAMGLSDQLAHASLRFSLGRFTAPADVDAAVETVAIAVQRLRR